MADGSWNDIEGALNAQTAALGLSVPVVYENMGSADSGITDAVGTFVDQAFLPAPQTAIEIGDAGRNRMVGVYQLAVNIPQGEGKKGAYDIALLVTEAFKRGTMLSNGGTSVRCVSADIEPGFESGMHFRVPISINWLATVANQ